MKIGSLELELLAKPEKVEEQIERMVGLTVAEVRAMLPKAAIADHVAAALLPFLKDAPARVELAAAIAAHGIIPVRAEVLRLYDKLLGVKPAAAPKAKPNAKP